MPKIGAFWWNFRFLDHEKYLRRRKIYCLIYLNNFSIAENYFIQISKFSFLLRIFLDSNNQISEIYAIFWINFKDFLNES